MITDKDTKQLKITLEVAYMLAQDKEEHGQVLWKTS